MTLRLIPLTRLACAVAALGLPLAAQAQQYWHASCAYDAPSPLATGGFYDGESDAVSGCIRSISEGRAAVLLPSALRSIKRVPTDTSLRGHAWGFLDGQGRLAIKPIFDQVGDFHHGLAAVQWQGKWGYIDARGRMAIAPRFDEVSDFVEAGLAIVTLDGKRQIIDRQGKPTGDALDASVDNAQLSDGLPARLIVRYRPEYQAPDGTRRYDEPGRRITGAYGKDLLIAATESGEYGLLNDKWEWVVEPRYEEITVQSDWTLAVAQGREEVVLLDAKGEAIGAGKGYRSLAPMGAFWLAELRRGSYELLDAKGQRLGNIDERQSRRIEPIGKALLSMSGDTAKLWVPGRTEAVTLGKDLATPRQTQGYALFLSEARRPLGLLTPGGGWVDGAALPAAVGQIDGFDEVHGRLWLHDADGKLLAVFNPDGKPALDAAALAALSEQPMRALRHAGPDAPLALLTQGHCQCEEARAGLVLADGTIVTDPSWESVASLDESEDEYGGDEDGDKPAANDMRFVARTEAGMRLLDARGKPMDLPPQQHIGQFRHGYALAYAQGAARIVDRAGKLYELPDFFEAEVAGPGLVRFLNTAAEGDPWGLYDFIAGKEISPPAFQRIGMFRDGRAEAALGENRAGIIDTQGKWIVPPEYREARPEVGDLWQLRQAGSQTEEYLRPSALASRDGRVLTPFAAHLEVAQDASGGYMARTNQRLWQISRDTTSVREISDADITPLGGWLGIQRSDRLGYVDSSGSWQIAPERLGGSVFHGSPARALRLGHQEGQEDRLVDTQGNTVATLPVGDWSWPTGSDWLIRQRHVANQGMVTDYFDTDGKPRLSAVPGRVGAYSEGRAVKALANGQARAVNEQGKHVGPVYDELWQRRDGLAVARVDQHYGYVDGQGKLAIPATYARASTFQDQRAVASTDAASLLIDTRGDMLASIGMECGMRTLRNARGQRLWPLSLPPRCPAEPTGE